MLGLGLVAEAKRTHKPKAPADTADCKTDADCVLVPGRLLLV